MTAPIGWICDFTTTYSVRNVFSISISEETERDKKKQKEMVRNGKKQEKVPKKYQDVPRSTKK